MVVHEHYGKLYSRLLMIRDAAGHLLPPDKCAGASGPFGNDLPAYFRSQQFYGGTRPVSGRTSTWLATAAAAQLFSWFDFHRRRRVYVVKFSRSFCVIPV